MVVIALMFFAHTVLAQPAINELTSGVASKSGYNTAIDKYELSRTVGRIIQAVMALIGTLFLALTVYAGFLWLTAGGNDESVTKSKDILKQAVIGLIVVLSAYSITVFVAMMMANTGGDRGFWGVFYSNSFGSYNGMTVNQLK